MTRFTIDAEIERGRREGKRYSEFLRVPSLSSGVYVLPAGGEDTQKPHTEDEIYYVVRGRARFRQGTSEQAVAPGDVLFVPAREPHHFHSVTEELVLLVAFGPAERTS
jgi:mannose-6-phosphate isomerase-like protein (cupin superfamily)